MSYSFDGTSTLHNLIGHINLALREISYAEEALERSKASLRLSLADLAIQQARHVDWSFWRLGKELDRLEEYKREFRKQWQRAQTELPQQSSQQQQQDVPMRGQDPEGTSWTGRDRTAEWQSRSRWQGSYGQGDAYGRSDSRWQQNRAAHPSGQGLHPPVAPSTSSGDEGATASRRKWGWEEKEKESREHWERQNKPRLRPDGSRSRPSGPDAAAQDALEAGLAWDSHVKRWAAISHMDISTPLRFHQIPWPLLYPESLQQASSRSAIFDNITSTQVGSFILNPHHSAGVSSKVRLRRAIMFWHPDKFEARWLRRVDERDRDLVRECVGAIAVALNELMAREKT